MFRSPLFWKIVTLGGAILLLLIPLTMVRQIIVERRITAMKSKMLSDRAPAGRKRW